MFHNYTYFNKLKLTYFFKLKLKIGADLHKILYSICLLNVTFDFIIWNGITNRKSFRTFSTVLSEDNNIRGHNEL